MATEEIGTDRAALSADLISGRIDRLPFLPFHWRIGAILGTGTLFDAFNSLSIGAALTMIIATFKIDYKTGGALISAAFAGQFVGAIACGYFGERIGRKWTFVLALAIFGACSSARRLGPKRRPDPARPRDPGRRARRRGAGRRRALHRVRPRQRPRPVHPDL